MSHKGSRGRFAATLALTAVMAGAAIALVSGGIASGSSSTAQYEYGHPAPTAAPVVTGTATVGQTLTTSNGTWSSGSNISLYGYAWGRCDTSGNNCVAIGGANASTYVLTDADQGHTLRSYVTATNSAGSTQNMSAQTAVVASGIPTGKQIDASKVVLPNRLVIDKVQYSANPIRARKSPTTMKVHVVDSHQNSVQNANVYVLGVPYSRIANMPEVKTDSTGWATLQLQPAQAFPRTGYLTLFVRSTVPGQDLLGGSSTRRLVQVTIAAPNGT
jgi:hypothetical protein